jgi:hypothetical protein
LRKEGYDVRKIPTLFERDWDGDRRYVLTAVVPGCEWVTEGEGIPTRKFDGTCFALDDSGEWWARREVKAGKPEPAHFLPLETDPETGKTVGWEPAEQSAFARWHAEATTVALGAAPDVWRNSGTYELVGPKINGNPEGYSTHLLIFHDGADKLPDAPRDYEGLAAYLHAHPYEGIVWHHPDGRMAKIKKRDFREPQ